jgi:hypothetical protein
MRPLLIGGNRANPGSGRSSGWGFAQERKIDVSGGYDSRWVLRTLGRRSSNASLDDIWPTGCGVEFMGVTPLQTSRRFQRRGATQPALTNV